MIVKEFHLENSVVRIHDDFITKDEEEKQRILDRAWAIIDGALLRSMEEKETLKEA